MNEPFFSTSARAKLMKGVNAVANSVKVTMGARGRNVIIGKHTGSPHITKDGVTVAKSVFCEDPIEKIASELIKEVATKTVDISGDGTTAATVLAQAIFSNGLKAVESGCNPMDIKRGIETGVKKTIEYLKSISNPVDNDSLLMQIASVSANNDKEIGGLIAEVFSKIGKDGVVRVEESHTSETNISVVEGLKIDRGYISPHFVTNQGKMQAELESPYILLFDKKISKLSDIINILDIIARDNKSLLIISEDVDGEALSGIVVNKLRGVLKICAVKSPEFGEARKQVMQDIAVVTGGTYISEESGLKLESTTLGMLGKCSKVVIDGKTCTIIGGAGAKEKIDERHRQISVQLESSTLDYEKDKLKTRMAKLKNGVAVVSVGGTTETEISEKKDRIDDSICATRAAIEEGFLLGGGVSLLLASNKISAENLTEDEKIGFNILRKSLESPFRQILENAGLEASAYVKDVLSSKFGVGVNVINNSMQDLFEAGIIDPTKVIRVSLKNAASISCMMLTTECVIPPPVENAPTP